MSKLKKLEDKEKVGTILDKNIVKKIKDRSHTEGRSISEIIQDAILKYEELEPTKLELRKSAVNRFCSKPFNLNQTDIEEILTEDYYEQ
ncbi:MAG TPA: hypothetical protein VJ954_05365 [Ignavibacteriaceae bacterium]|nr:hypothetical protein [Ignavibacteriaceae bacterium]